MNLLVRVGLWLVEHVSRSDNRHALCGDLLEQLDAGRSRAWLVREVLAAVGEAMMRRFCYAGIAVLFATCWSALYRGYAMPQPAILFSQWSDGLTLFPLPAITHLLLQILPVDAFLWFGLVLFASVRRDVLRSLTLKEFGFALLLSHTAMLLLVIMWPKHHLSPHALVSMLSQGNFYLGLVNLPVAASLLIGLLCVWPEGRQPPRRRRVRKGKATRDSTALPIRGTTLGMVGAILLASSGVLDTHAQSPRELLTPAQLSSINAFVTSEMQREHVPGIAVGVYSRGTILLAKGYGLSNVELNVPVKPETIFQSGSVGKQFLSAAVMMLVEEGKLSLDDSVAKFFPDAPVTWQPIQLKNLLSHTSGLSEYESPERTSAAGPFYMRLDFTEDDLVKKIENLPIENTPGDKWNYRNTNYVLLGVLLHRVTGMPYADFLTQRIFRPLGMVSTQPISEANIVPNRAAGYELHGTQLKNQQWVSPTFNSTGDGTLYSNVLDLAKWDAALYGPRLLKQSSLDRIWTVFPLNNGKPNPGSYGFGWELDPQNGHKRIEHGGSWQGFTCEISRYPDDSLTVVVLTNLDSAHARPALFTHAIAGLVVPQLAPSKLAEIPDDEPATTMALRNVLDRMTAGQDVRDLVGQQLAKAVTADMMRALQARFKPLWPGGVVTLVRRQAMPDEAKTRISLYRLKKDDHSLLLEFAVDGFGKITRFNFHEDSEY